VGLTANIRRAMCWRWEVSLASASMEWMVATYLWRRKFDSRDRPYSLFVASLALMESTQGLLWWFALSPPTTSLEANRRWNLFLSIGIWFCAWVHVPLSIVHFGSADKSVKSSPWKGGFSLYFVIQALLVLATMALFGEMYTTVGPKGHQIWPCTPALMKLEATFSSGSSSSESTSATLSAQGSPAHGLLDRKQSLVSPGFFSHSHWHLCTIICMVYAALCQLSLIHLPIGEQLGFGLPGGISFMLTYYYLGPTMEACSTWCWMAGVFSVYFLFRHKIFSRVETYQRVEEKVAPPRSDLEGRVRN